MCTNRRRIERQSKLFSQASFFVISSERSFNLDDNRFSIIDIGVSYQIVMSMAISSTI